MHEFDDFDRRILGHIQTNADTPVAELGEAVGLSRNACWRRIKMLEEMGYIERRVALVNPKRAGLPLMVFIQVRAGHHDKNWLEQFKRAVRSIPQIMGAHRMTGDLDYLIRARVADMEDYDRLYQRLIAAVDLSDVSASFVMEDIKDTTALPL
ncbi:MAG: Lrp/AsnC family transcriptional regulator [Pseudomonadota bacterium]